MLDIFLSFFYISGKIFFFPFELLWNLLFSTNIRQFRKQKIVILDTIGGSGKTTLASEISLSDMHKHIRIDDMKFGENWKRYSDEEFKDNLHKSLKYQDYFVLEGTYSDPRLPIQSEEIDKIIETSDMIIWFDIPKYIALWRKLFRSFKRAIGMAAPGSGGVETLENIINMTKKGYYTFEERYEILDEMFEKNKENPKFHRVKWPYFYIWY